VLGISVILLSIISRTQIVSNDLGARFFLTTEGLDTDKSYQKRFHDETHELTSNKGILIA
jgi:hypothetical protein